jgi:hypothetical protein
MAVSTPILLHGATLSALVLWALNDHCFKALVPGWWTGKLSDVAAMMVLPAVLLGAAEWASPDVVARHSRRLVAGACVLSGLLLVGLETSEMAESCYQHVLGYAQYPVRAVWAWCWGELPIQVAPVETTPDVTDLWTLPALAVPWLLGRPPT